jgi:hypothetical protein
MTFVIRDLMRTLHYDPFLWIERRKVGPCTLNSMHRSSGRSGGALAMSEGLHHGEVVLER